MSPGVPNIHLIKSPYHSYLFDVNTNLIIQISERLYQCFKEKRDIDFINQCTDVQEEYQNLISQGYLKDRTVQVLNDIRTQDLDYYTKKKLHYLILQVTQQCNFRCSYCPYTLGDGVEQRSHSSKRMDWKTAKATVDFFIDRTRDCNAIYVGFYGGEPLLEWPLIKKTIEYIEKKLEGKEIIFSMTTNASLMTVEMAKFFATRNIHIMVSLDGPKEVHDRNRRLEVNGEGTFDKIFQNLDFLLREVPSLKKKISYNSVVDPENNLEAVDEFFAQDFFEDTPVNTDLVNPPFGTRLYIGNEFLRREKINRLIGLLYGNGVYRDSTAVKVSAKSHLEKTLKQMEQFEKKQIELPVESNHSGPCIPGVTKLFVTYEGEFIACERCNETKSYMKIGNIREGFDLEKISRLLNFSQLIEKDCKKCWAFSHCTICAAKLESYSDEISTKLLKQNCVAVRKETDDMLRIKIAMMETKEMGDLG